MPSRKNPPVVNCARCGRSFDRVEQRLRRIEGHVTSESYELHRELERMARS